MTVMPVLSPDLPPPASGDDPAAFLYAPGRLDPDAAHALTARALAGADDGELYLQYRVSEAFGFDDGRLKTCDYATDAGFGLRAVAGEQTGFAQASDLSAGAIAEAAGALTLVQPGRLSPPPAAPPRTNRHRYTAADPIAAVPLGHKIALLERIDAAARARDPRVVQLSASLQASWSVIEIVRADGFVARDIRPLVRLGVSVVLADGDRRETGSFGCGGRHLYDPLFDEPLIERAIDAALAQAEVNLAAMPAPAGQMPVLLAPGWPGILLHEAVGHGLEGDFNRRGTSAFSGRLGTRVAAPGVTVVDDGTLPGRRGSLTIDDEGTPTEATVLIEDGILKGYMHDRLNARLMGHRPTGNGRRESYAHAPMPRMTNTVMLAGGDEPGALVERMGDGIFAKSFGGGQVDIVSGKFVFSCTEAYRVRGGRLAEPVKGATLIGDGPSVLTRIEGLGHDFALDEGIGMCGKGGQGVPAGVGQPTVLVGGLTVGGTA